MSWLGLKGSRTIVIGAGGLGAAVVKALSSAGACVAVIDRDPDRLNLVATEVRDEFFGTDVIQVAADLSTPEACRMAINAAVEQLGGLDGYVHAVGVNDRRPILELGDEDWDRLMTVNLSTAYWSAQEAGRIMCASGYGRLVFISSVSGLLAHADHSIYATSKAGLNQLMRAMAREWSAAGVEVNAVAPGYVETELTSAHLAKAGVRAALESQVPAGRLGAPEEVANAITFLLSRRSSFITGQVLYVDGGRTLV